MEGRAPRVAIWVLLSVVGLTVVGTVVATMRYGIGLTPDSVVYLDGAESLADGRGYTREGVPITIFPPGYPAVLAVGERLGLSTVGTARLIAVISAAGTTLLGYVLLRRHVRSTSALIAGTIVIGCSAVLLGVFKRALTEHLFLLVVLLLLLAAEELADRPRNLRLLAASAVLVWVGFYLRYAAIVMLPFMALVVLIATWPLGRVQALVRSAAFGAVAFAGPALLMLRNIDEGSGAMGGRQDASASPFTNVGRTAVTLGGWLAFDGPVALRLAAVVAVVAAAAAVLVATGVPSRSRLVAGGREMWPIILFLAVYVVYLIGTASVVAFAAIQTRYLIAVFVPGVVLAAWGFERAHGRLLGSARTVLSGAVALWIGANVVWFGARSVEAARHGAGGYATVDWHTSRIMRDVRSIDPAVPLFSNDPKAIQLFADRPATESVAKTWVGTTDPTGDLPEFLELVACEGRIELVWFEGPGTRTRLYTPTDLAEHLDVVPQVARDDGTIYEVTPNPAGPRCP